MLNGGWAVSDNQETPTQASEFEGHTPGPWSAGFHCPEVIVGGENFRVIANLSTELPGAEMRANSELIEAAPRLLRERDEARAERDELVKACKELATVRVSGNGADLQEAIEAIEKLLSRLNTQGGGQ